MLPPIVTFWRGQNERRWLVYGRYSVAVFIFWAVVICAAKLDTDVRVRKAEAIGDIESAIADTGQNAAAVAFGWIPGLGYGLILAGARWLLLACSRKK